MTIHALLSLTCCVCLGLGLSAASGQSANTAAARVAAARTAAGQEHVFLFDTLCGPAAPAPAATAPAPANAMPDRASWHAEPVKVFDNLYYVGEIEYSAWAITTTDGIILRSEERRVGK